MRLIITCGCGDTTQFAKDAFKIMFPKDKIDKLVEKPDSDLLLTINNYLSDYVGKDIDFSEPYALLLDDEYYNKDMERQMVKIYDLIKGARIC